MAINRTWQKRILAEAQASGRLHELYWYPVAQNGPRDKAVAVGGAVPSIPVVPVAPDPEISRHWAHLLLNMFAIPGVEFAADLTTAEILDESGIPWFIWGLHDHICPGCGAINGDCICVAIHEITHDPPLPADDAGADVPLIDSSPTIEVLGQRL